MYAHVIAREDGPSGWPEKFAGKLAKFAQKPARYLPKNRQRQQTSDRAESCKNSDHWRTSYSCPGGLTSARQLVTRRGGEGYSGAARFYYNSSLPPRKISHTRPPSPHTRPLPLGAQWRSKLPNGPKCSQPPTICRRR